MEYIVENPDFIRSPFTGMVRRNWLAAAQFLIDGVFRHIDSLDKPVLLPRQNKICYPNPGDPVSRYKAEEFEGISRTLLAAMPLFVEDPGAESNGIRLLDYYRRQILLMTDPSSSRYLGTITGFNCGQAKQVHQHTCEGGLVALCLMLAREPLWNSFSLAEKQQVADLVSNYAHERTNGQNWRMFNMLMLTFLKTNGFEIDDMVLNDHAQNLMSMYAGDGWYADNISFDMYNPWAFHFWLPFWCALYGYEHAPEIAAVIEARNRRFMETWPRFYGRNGHQLMWGRSIIYRFACSAALPAHFVMRNPVLDPGFARRIASANLLQFIGREDFYLDGVPCIGYYGPFAPLAQPYSCAASPFWFAQAFSALMLPSAHPFWKAEENEGFWPELGERSETVELSGPGIQVINHGKTGTTEIRTAKVSHREPYYNQLQFNTAFCWEAETGSGANAGTYSFRETGSGEPFHISQGIGYSRFDNGVLYRQLNLKSSAQRPYFGGEWMDLADITIPGGVIRIDRLRVAYGNDLILGHLALPHVDHSAAEVTRFEVEGCSAISAQIAGRSVAMSAIHGWKIVSSVRHKGLNPEAEESTVIYAERSGYKDYPGIELFITVMLHRQDNGAWLEDELMPIKQWRIIPWTEEGFPCAVEIELKDGRSFLVDYKNIDGNRRL